MKYTLKRARGLFSIRRKAPETNVYFYPWKCGWIILKRGTMIPRDTVKPFTTFADIYRANHAFGLNDYWTKWNAAIDALKWLAENAPNGESETAANSAICALSDVGGDE